ncbi:MAG: cyanophycinase [Armatimonadetes bacterium]|nr:cyanophycinase [Armatimonadota bacterium]
MVAILAAFALAAATSHGPENGTLFIVGGGSGGKVMPKFFELAGGKDAKIVVIPTASADGTFTAEGIKSQRPWSNAARVDVLHTRDRNVADSEDFVKPLLDATAVWFGGGRHWRLADSYLGTRTEQEIKNVLKRGGIVGGSSAGATIQGSFLIRGAPGPDGKSDGDNRIMESPGHLVGLGLITDCAIDQHVITRHRENDLEAVIANHPELLGIGIDEGTAIIVRKDVFEVIGPSKVFIYDNEAHGDSRHYTLSAGDKFDLANRKKID